MPNSMYPIDFSFLEHTFRDQPARLVKLLELMEREFSHCQWQMSEYLREGNIDAFRDLKHKLLPSLNYLQMDEFRDLLETIKQAYLDDPESFDPEKYTEEMDSFFEIILQGVSQKLMALRTTTED